MCLRCRPPSRRSAPLPPQMEFLLTENLTGISLLFGLACGKFSWALSAKSNALRRDRGIQEVGERGIFERYQRIFSTRTGNFPQRGARLLKLANKGGILAHLFRRSVPVRD